MLSYVFKYEITDIYTEKNPWAYFLTKTKYSQEYSIQVCIFFKIYKLQIIEP